MTGMVTLTPMTVESMSAQAVHLGSTVLAMVWQAQGNHHAEDHGNPDGITIHLQPDG